MNHSKKKTVFSDLLAPRGHLTLNNFYIERLAFEDDVLLFGESFKDYFIKYKNIKTFSESYLKKGRIVHSTYTFLLGLVSILMARKRKANLCFLSYDITNFFILTYIAKIFGVDVFAFEHNTSPGKSKIKAILQGLCSRSITRFCYTSLIKTSFKYNKNIKVIPHPLLINLSQNSNLEPTLEALITSHKHIVFSPSAMADTEKVLKTAKAMPDVLFILKSSVVESENNVYVKAFFENYDKIMEVADFIYLPLHDTNRISGPFFEAVCKNKNILLERNRFGIYMYKHFPEHVQYIDAPFYKRRVNFDISNYNRKIAISLGNILNE